MRFVIYVDDHEPAHVHVKGQGEAKVSIAGNRPVILKVAGMTRADQRRMLREIKDRQRLLLARWNELHG